MTLEPGETVDLGTRCGGGLTVHRDEQVDDEFQIDGHGGVLSRGEIERLAELAGLEVTES